AHPLPAACGCSAAFPVRHPPAKCLRFRSFRTSRRTAQNWFLGDEKRKLATCPGLAFNPDLPAHALQKAARNGQSKAHALSRFAAWQAKEIVKNLQVKFRPYARPCIGHAHL